MFKKQFRPRNVCNILLSPDKSSVFNKKKNQFRSMYFKVPRRAADYLYGDQIKQSIAVDVCIKHLRFLNCLNTVCMETLPLLLLVVASNDHLESTCIYLRTC